MELSYTYLHTKEVVNVVDGRRLGKVSDVLFSYPENCVYAIVAPGRKCFLCKKNEQIIDIRNIVKFGDDVVLVNLGNVIRRDKCGRGVPPRNTATTNTYCEPPEQYSTSRRDMGEYE